MHLSRTQIDEMEHLYKINLMNSVSGYRSANLAPYLLSDNVAVISGQVIPMDEGIVFLIL